MPLLVARQGTTIRTESCNYKTRIAGRLGLLHLECPRCSRTWWTTLRAQQRPYTRRPPRPCRNCGPTSGNRPA